MVEGRRLRIEGRRFRRYSALVGIGLIVAACQTASSTGSSPDPSGSLVVVSPGGSYGTAMNAAYFQPFENETGIGISLVEGGEDAVAGARAQVESGNVSWDLVLCGPSIVAANQDIYAEIPSEITADDVIFEAPYNERAVINDVEAFPLVAYSKSAFPNGGPTDAAGFFDTAKYPGPRGIPDIGLDTAYQLPALALLADGVPADKLFPLDLDRAYRKLDSLKPSIRVVWTSYTQSQDILRSGEVVVNLMSDGRALQLINSGQDVAVSFTNGFRVAASWCIPKGAPHADAAHKFLSYIQDNPAQQAVFTSLTYYGPPTQGGVDAAKKLGVSDFSTAHNDELIPESEESVAWIQANSDELLARWNAWLNQ